MTGQGGGSENVRAVWHHPSLVVDKATQTAPNTNGSHDVMKANHSEKLPASL